jgi:DNA polymerase V
MFYSAKTANPVEDVWGIGRRYAAMLARHGVTNARQFRDLPRDWVKKKMTVGGLHTQLELRGLPCLSLEEFAPVRKSVVSSRSFGRPVSSIEDMHEALSMHVSRASERLRAARLVANGVTAWVQTNNFIAGEPQYANSAYAALPLATSHIGDILKVAAKVLEKIFRRGFRYKKVGVMLSGLERLGNRQLSLLEPTTEPDPRGERLMAALDGINSRFGRDTIRLAACGVEQGWKMKQAARSPRYTTAWDELPVVKVS